MDKKYILAHDLGTSAAKAVITDLKGKILAWAEIEYDVHYAEGGIAEQDPEKWWQAIVSTTHEALGQIEIKPAEIAALSTSSQFVNTVPVDETGTPLRPALTWLDSRAHEEAQILQKQTRFDFIDAKSCAAKAFWIKRNEPDIYEKTHKFLDAKDYLHFRLTGEYTTDFSTCFATFLFTPWTQTPWTRVLDVMGIPADKLPTSIAPTEQAGCLTAVAAKELGLAEGTPVFSGGGDMVCSAVGAGAITNGRSHAYLGTSGWVMTIVPEFMLEVRGIFPMVSCDPNSFLLAGEMDNVGNCLKWFQHNFLSQEDRVRAIQDGISIYQYMDRMADSVPPGSDGLLFLPWIWGERTPVDDEHVRGGFANMGLNHTKAHFVRAILEGVGHHLRWIADELTQAGAHLDQAHIIGGGAKSTIWLQLLADITGMTLLQVEEPWHAGARGAAMIAAVGLGVYPDFATVQEQIQLTGAVFTPNPQHRTVYDQAYANFRSLYQPLSDIGHKRVPTPKLRERLSPKQWLEKQVIRLYVARQVSKSDTP